VRILHVVPTYLPARRYGGPIFAVHGLARGLAARGHHVDVVTTNVDGAGVSDVPVGVPVHRDGVQVHYFRSPFPRLYWSPAMRFAAADYDLVHLHSVFLYPTSAAARAARKASVPYVISPRGMLVEELIARRSPIAKRLWLRLFERRNFEHARAIHFTSRLEWDDARATGLPLPSPFVVPNGIDLPPRLEVPRDPATIVFLGRISWKKGIDRLIGALAHLPQARLEVAGNDEEKLTPRLQELAARLGVGTRVSFPGPVNDDAKNALLHRATVFALTSLSENFANSVLEAMAAAAPVVVTPGVGLADEVARARAGIVAGDGPAEIASAIGTLIEERGLAAEMGARGRALVEERFTWSSIAATMEKEYDRLRR
jgi:glycosyltransferase involved in cell wall biosynthesis